jgi:hypothetical protein
MEAHRFHDPEAYPRMTKGTLCKASLVSVLFRHGTDQLP